MSGELLILLFSSAALLVGPVAGVFSLQNRRLAAGYDGIAITLVITLIAVLVLPLVISELGMRGVFIVLCGAAFTRVLQTISLRETWPYGFLFAVIGLHALIDGALLNVDSEHGSGALPWVVVAHRVPFGFAIFAWCVSASDSQGRALKCAFAGIAAMILLTFVGFAVGDATLSMLPADGPEILEALVAGALIMFVLTPLRKMDVPQALHSCHDVHSEEHQLHHHASARSVADIHRTWAGVGALFGFLVCFVAFSSGLVAPSNPFIFDLARTLQILIFETAPALLIGFILAGVIPFVLTSSRVNSLRSHGRLTQAAKGVAYGLPLPICSCSVVPAYQSLIKRGAPPAAAIGFFVATPELGIDAVILSLPLLGESMTIARVTAALLVALLTAVLVRVPERLPQDPDGAEHHDEAKLSTFGRLRDGIRFGFVEVFDHTMPWIVLGLLLAAAAEPLLHEGFFSELRPVFQVPLAAITAIPLYVCASGATPIAALAIHKGLSAGAALTFLIAGPATNVTTFGVLSMLHGRRVALYFGLTILSLAIVAGWLVDWLGVAAVPLDFVHQAETEQPSYFQIACAAILGMLLVTSLLRQGPRGVLGHLIKPIHAH